MTREKVIFRECHQNSPTYGHVTKVFLELEFQHKGNKQKKKGEFSAKSCIFLGRNRFREQNYLNAKQKRTKKYWTDLSLLGQEPTFKKSKRRGSQHYILMGNEIT